MAIIKLLKKPEVTDLAGEKAMIDFDSGNYFLLKGAANDIWDLLREGVSTDEIVDSLTGIYEVDAEECRSTTVQFLQRLEELGFIRLVQA